MSFSKIKSILVNQKITIRKNENNWKSKPKKKIDHVKKGVALFILYI